MTDAGAASSRDYARLFGAMNAVLRVLLSGGDEKDALSLSFDAAAQGFGADKALLLLVQNEEPLRLRSVCARGLSEKQVVACERGDSVKGVSSSVIRSVLASRRALVVDNPYLRPESDMTPALAGENYSVLCAPLLHPLREGLHAQLMTALYRCGRRTEALDLFRSLRSRLVQELGMEPLPELRDLQQQMLSSVPVSNLPQRERLTGLAQSRRG